MKVIKLDESVLETINEIHCFESGIDSLIRSLGKRKKELWNYLKETFSQYNFAGSHIDDNYNLILPFEDVLKNKEE